MGVQVIMAAVEAAYRKDKFPTRFNFAAGSLAQYGAMPEIAAEPSEAVESFSGTRGAGAAGQPRSLWTRHARVTVRLWHEDEPKTEELLQHFISAVHRVAAGSYRPVGGRWFTGGAMTKGIAYALEMEFDIPVTREHEPSVPVTSMPTTAVIEEPEED